MSISLKHLFTLNEIIYEQDKLQTTIMHHSSIPYTKENKYSKLYHNQTLPYQRQSQSTFVRQFSF